MSLSSEISLAGVLALGIAGTASGRSIASGLANRPESKSTAKVWDGFSGNLGVPVSDLLENSDGTAALQWDRAPRKDSAVRERTEEDKKWDG